MMSADEKLAVSEVYRRLLDGEGAGVDCMASEWDLIDDQLTYLDFLEDDQLYREAEVMHTHQSKGVVKCAQEFCNQGCYAQNVSDAVGAILRLYKETNNLHSNNRYVLANYLALVQLGMIISDFT